MLFRGEEHAFLLHTTLLGLGKHHTLLPADELNRIAVQKLNSLAGRYLNTFQIKRCPCHCVQLILFGLATNYVIYSSIQIDTPRRQWTFLMLRSGHFAGAVFNGKDVVIHKGFHRYTARKKQGGDQLAADARGGNHKSAGANLRRANAKALIADIEGVVKEWSGHIRESHFIFLSASSR